MSLLNLLDNYTPFVSTIYSNKFLEYFNAMIRIWAMLMSLERHHYDKAPLVWIAMCTYWGIRNPDLHLMLRLFLLMFDEYPVDLPTVSLDQRLMTVTQWNSYSKTQKLHFKQKQLSVHLSHILHPHLASLSGKNN